MTNRKVDKAIAVIREYCDSIPACKKCPYRLPDRSCSFTAKFPSFWNMDKGAEEEKRRVERMKRLTTDCAIGNFEVMMNYVFVRDGWAHIVSDGERENVPLTTWAKAQCIKRGCDEFSGETPEEIDETLCDCLTDGDGCPVALAYCFASQACHLRDRLKQYEDTGKDPMGKPLEGTGTDE